MKFLYGVSGLLVTALGASGCGQKQKNQDSSANSVYLETQIPEDTTGSKGDVQLKFSTTSGDLFQLLEGEEQSAVLAINDKISLDYAKLSIAKFKIKAKKEVSEAEENLEEIESNEEMQLVEEEDAGVGVQADRDGSTWYRGPFVYNIISQEIEDDVGEVSIADGSYHRIEFQLKRNNLVDDDEPLRGNAFALQGSLKDGEADIRFEIDWHVALNFRLTSDSPFKVSSNDDNDLIVNFDLNSWFKDVDLSTAKKKDGVIYINKNNNQKLMQAIHNNIKMSASFGKDKNNDGKLDKDEQVGDSQDIDDPIE